ncbi:MAG: hypothetical protein Q8S18_05360, partial [Bacteroidales bacterium]|nr:hypothetical protein [Bacteroidales bacterium]
MKKLLLLVAVLFLWTQSSWAQLTVNVTNPTNTTPNMQASYASFAAALTDLNLVSAMSGPVTLTLQAGSETAPIKGFVIGSESLNGAISDVNTITINTSGGTVTINADVGTSNGPSATPDGMLLLNGADYVTINGITFTDGNSTNATVAMEFGIALFKRSAGDGSNFNTIQNCTFNMQRVNNASGSGPMVEGSVGIGVYNSVYTAGTTALTPTNGGTLATNGTNSNNKFYGNNFNSGNYGIALNGFAATVGVGPTPTPSTFIGDLNNDIGGSAGATGNTILNFGGGGTNVSAGIRANNQWSVNISYNTIDNNNGSGINHTGTMRGIFAQAGLSASANINNNSVTVRSGATTSQLTAIDNGIGSTAVSSNTININNNTIRFSYTTATTGVFSAVSNTATAGTVNINSNNIQQLASTNYSSTGTIAVIVGGSPGGPLNITNNTISNFVMTGASGTLRGITASTPTGLYTVTGNTIENLSYTTVTSTGSIIGIYNLASATLQNWNNNIIRNFSTPTTGTLNGIQNNTVGGTFQCKNNQIYNFSTTSGGAGGFTANGILWSNATVEISGNEIYSINSTGTTGGVAGIINGISVAGSSSVYKNKIYNISTASTTTTAGAVNGILLTGGVTSTVYNNLIGDLRATASASTDAVRGISITSTTTSTTYNVYYNTVYLNASSTGTNFGTAGIFHTASATSTTANLNLRNNIIVNNSTAAGTGLVVAFRRSNGIANMLNNYNSGSNNNLFYAGVPGASNLIYSDGTSTAQTMTQYKNGVFTAGTIAPRDAASFTENPVFQSTTGSNANFLKIDLTAPTQIESGGQAIGGITDDYWGTVRNATTPDVGAFEGDMTLLDLIPPAISYTPLVNTSSLVSRTMVVAVNDPSGVPTTAPGWPNLYWRINDGSWTAATPTDVTGSNYTYSFGTGVAPGDVVQYYVVAQDIAGTPNVGAFPSAGATGFTTNPPAASTPPTTPSSYTIVGALSGTYSVGAGKDYATLTAAITDLNGKEVTGAVVFELWDATYPAETFPIIIQKPARANPTDLITIRPKAGVSSVVSGSSATGILVLMGSDYIVLDGSNSGGTDRSLTWENTSTAASTYVVGLFHNGTVGASNNVIKNNIVKAGSKTVATTWAIVLNSAGGGYNNITIQNNEVLNAYVGLQFVGISGNAATNGLVTQNVFGSDNDAVTLGNTAINVSQTDGLIISNNTIKNLQSGNNPVGILLSTNTLNTNVLSNSISKLYYIGTGGYGAKGIVVNTASPTSNILLANNMISDLRGDGWSSLLGDAVVGIRIGAHASSATATGGVKVYYNSVNLGSGTFAGNSSGTISAALYLGSLTTNI